MPGGGKVCELLRKWWGLWERLAVPVARSAFIRAVHNTSGHADSVWQPIDIVDAAFASKYLSQDKCGHTNRMIG